LGKHLPADGCSEFPLFKNQLFIDIFVCQATPPLLSGLLDESRPFFARFLGVSLSFRRRLLYFVATEAKSWFPISEYELFVSSRCLRAFWKGRFNKLRSIFSCLDHFPQRCAQLKRSLINDFNIQYTVRQNANPFRRYTIGESRT
jgi:hypothetical protein